MKKTLALLFATSAFVLVGCGSSEGTTPSCPGWSADPDNDVCTTAFDASALDSNTDSGTADSTTTDSGTEDAATDASKDAPAE